MKLLVEDKQRVLAELVASLAGEPNDLPLDIVPIRADAKAGSEPRG
ncbi:MAG: hypothetical protein HY719_10490 [Planctomycetes bacterium]|nr:hypothetical protein [Planctomycetota bacterium]